MESSNKSKKIMKSKVIFTTNKEVTIVIDDIKTTFLDEMMLRFPHIVQDVFEELDNKSLTNCRNLSRACCDFIDDEKLYWVRKIQDCVHMTEFQQQWNKVLKKIPTKVAKEIFATVEHFFQYDLNRKKLKWPPLHIAAEQGQLELCKFIIKKTKDPNPTSEDGITAIHMATHNGCQEVCELIINNLGDKNPADNKGITPFHIASEKGHLDVCKLLIQHIDNKNPSAHDGCTPLHLAADHCHLEIAQLIVESGVQKSPLFKGRTPLDLVKPRSCWSFYKLLCDDNSQILQRIFSDMSPTFFIFLFAYSYILAFCAFGYLFLSTALAFERDDYKFLRIFTVALTIDLLLVAMIWVYLSGCIHKYTNNNCFAWMSCLHK